MGSERIAYGLAGCKAQCIIFILHLDIYYQQVNECPYICFSSLSGMCLNSFCNHWQVCWAHKSLFWLIGWLIETYFHSPFSFPVPQSIGSHRMKMVAPPDGRGSLNGQVEHANTTTHLNNLQ